MFALIVCLIGVKFLTNYRNGKNRVSSKNVYIPFQNLLYHFKMSTKYITVYPFGKPCNHTTSVVHSAVFVGI